MGIRGLDRGESAALVIHECQNGMVSPAIASNAGLAANAAGRGVVARIAALAGVCRELGVPVVHSTIEPRPDGVGSDSSCLLLGALMKKGQVVAGKPAAEIHPDLAPQPGDIRIRRVHGLTPFHGTELEAYLRERGVRTVVLAGVSSDVGIPGAALEAVNRGFRVVVPEDCIAGSSQDAHDWQVAHTLPLLATVGSADAVAAVLRART
ncbi:isochorismatase family cysteine hydrolase [Streptomyces sp. NPDC021080]|uniref:isochorismatase family cysteine hydrolase n=1 Tax=Streptomyces sp. NPDC021080 TaxID=3365110 RepID=UPI00378A0832